MEALPQDLADFLVTKNFDTEYFDKKGDPSEAGKATTIKFDYVAGTGKNYGTAVCVIADNELSLFYGDNLGRGMEPEDKDKNGTDFLEQLSNHATSHSAFWTPTDINQTQTYTWLVLLPSKKACLKVIMATARLAIWANKLKLDW
jgi:hypothetical protein